MKRRFLQERRRRWPWILATLGIVAVVLAVALYLNPFLLIDAISGVYLRAHAVQHRHITVDGHSIHYLEATPPAGAAERPILLVHGLGARATDWAPMIPALAAHGYHVYAIDLLGYGESEKPANGDFTLTGEERLVVDFLSALHIPKADVAGWSMGGWVSMLVALDHPEVVHRLLLYDSAGLYFKIDFPMTLFSPRDRAGLDALVARIEPDKPHFKIPGFAVHGMLQRFRANRWILDKSFHSMLTGRSVLDFRVSQLQMPVLIIWGTEDHLTRFDQALRLHELISQSVLVGVPGCGHLALAECTEQVLPSTLRFLDADPPLPASSTILAGPAQR